MSLIDTASNVTIDKHKARELLDAYRHAKAPATDEDRAIMEAYRQIARGRVVIQVEESIRAAGWNDDATPRLAMTAANERLCECYTGGSEVEFYANNRGYKRARFTVSNMPPRPDVRGSWRHQALVPLIPLHLRPKAALSNYWILWEADWHRAPADPLLLRKLDGDLWIVLAAWELTAVERAVLERRIATS